MPGKSRKESATNGSHGSACTKPLSGTALYGRRNRPSRVPIFTYGVFAKHGPKWISSSNTATAKASRRASSSRKKCFIQARCLRRSQFSLAGPLEGLPAIRIKKSTITHMISKNMFSAAAYLLFFISFSVVIAKQQLPSKPYAWQFRASSLILPPFTSGRN